MKAVIDFFIAPYEQASLWNILLEITAALFGVLSVFYAMRENIKVYPTGIVSTSIYIYITCRAVLYGDALINVYYTGMSLYGWYRWTHPKENQTEVPITYASRKDWITVGLIFSSTLLFVVAAYLYFHKFNHYTNYIDTLTTALFFVGMWLMAEKKIESWHFWIFGNAISIPLYFVKGLGFTGLQFSVFLILALYGLKGWKEIYDAERVAYAN